MIYVMSDIHGIADRYQEMLELIDFNEQDTLYVLGDIIDRGNGSIKVLQDMMRRPNVHGIFGNHEWMCVECMKWLSEEISEASISRIDEEQLMKLSDWINNGAYPTIRELLALSLEERMAIMDYLLDFSAYEEITVNGKYYLLVHAGLGNFQKDKPLFHYDVNDLIWERPDWEIPYFDEADRFVIVGHTPTLGISGKAEIFHHNQFIAIDCGACFQDGALACLCLDTMEEFYC